MKYENEHIENLIYCEKEIIEPPSKEYKKDGGHFKKNFTLRSVNGLYFFRAFIRQNIMFCENFSIGLDYKPKDEKGTICLLRCNGSHGENKQLPHHNNCHIHQATAKTINSGTKSESDVKLTNEYSTFDEAIQYFITVINLKQDDRNRYFPAKLPELFEGYGKNS